MTVLSGHFSMFEIASTNGRPPPDIAAQLEAYLKREKALAVWTHPHFVRYLRAMIYKLTPQPHRCVRRILTALQDGSLDVPPLHLDARPLRLRQLVTNPPYMPGAGRTAREAANAICEILGYQAGFEGVSDVKCPDEYERYHRAVEVATRVERAALAAGLTPDDLYACAVVANTDDELDPTRHDAAMAAITAGHFKLAHEIATEKS